ncbi:DsrE family protein [Hydrogenophilus thiooxidans]|uniref:DsrE family protein n=1 Tax=Hydrogenophilus thiooxidans TaxID=2820326 RepID=UPI001C23AB97|nr:DsrE family protein [Hydrogenophilus thiooxidans]
MSKATTTNAEPVPPTAVAARAPDRRRRLALTAPAALALAVGAARGESAGDGMPHKIVYQLNQADPEYIGHILNSISAMLGKYPDQIAIAVVCFGPGIHLIAKTPQRPIPEELRQRAKGQAEFYGVRYIACGNTMKTLGWGPEAIEPFAEIVEVGAAAIMELQEAGYAYLAW